MISLIICTYNPEVRIIKRAIKSVLNQNTTHRYELIIVDNNSSNKFDVDNEIIELTNNIYDFSIISEPRQGLAFARITGVKKAKYEIIVFVDDDNELSFDYLKSVYLLFNKYPNVKIWGAGNIQVDLVDGAEAWVKKYMMYFYQEKSLNDTLYGNEKGWLHYYPVGSGIAIDKQAFIFYLNDFENGQVTASGRSASSLSSGEDSQIIWSIIKKGYSVGSSPLLKLTHIIPKRRTEFEYLCKLNYNLSYSFHYSFKEVFGFDLEQRNTKFNYFDFFKLFLGCLRATKYRFLELYKVYFIKKKWLTGYNDYINSRK